MEKFIQKELFWNRVMFILIRGILVFGLVVFTLLFTVITGAIAVEGFDAPALLGGDHRAEILAYGLFALAILSALTKNGIFRQWRLALRQLHEIHATHVANIHRASRSSPEYYVHR